MPNCMKGRPKAGPAGAAVPADIVEEAADSDAGDRLPGPTENAGESSAALREVRTPVGSELWEQIDAASDGIIGGLAFNGDDDRCGLKETLELPGDDSFGLLEKLNKELAADDDGFRLPEKLNAAADG